MWSEGRPPGRPVVHGQRPTKPRGRRERRGQHRTGGPRLGRPAGAPRAPVLPAGRPRGGSRPRPAPFGRCSRPGRPRSWRPPPSSGSRAHRIPIPSMERSFPGPVQSSLVGSSTVTNASTATPAPARRCAGRSWTTGGRPSGFDGVPGTAIIAAAGSDGVGRCRPTPRAERGGQASREWTPRARATGR